MTTELSPALLQNVLDRLQTDLPPHFTYHNAAHTAYVLGCAQLIAQEEKLPEHEQSLLTVAALYHDTGFLLGIEAHEEASCAIARGELPAFGYSHAEINQICGMIMATRLPQSPGTHAECILADADLYYLGTDKYEAMSKQLYAERTHFNPSINRQEWFDIQVHFLTEHRYHTAYAKRELEPIKQANLHLLKEGYE